MESLSLAEQLRILFEAVQHPQGRPYTLQEVSDATGISLGTISHMRKGRIVNPQLHTLRVLCDFFGVTLRYFESKTPEECYIALSGSGEEMPPALAEIAHRASGLSEQAQRDILTLVKWVQAAEQQRKLGGQLPSLPGLEPYED